MSQEYGVTWVGDPREWQSSRGDTFLAYEIEVEGVQGKIEWSRKPDSDPPEVGGMTPLATIDNGSHGKKLKVDWNGIKEQKAGKPSTGSSGSANFAPAEFMKPLRPEVQRAIQRQHSQEMALRYHAFDKESASPTLAQIFQVADAFDKDIADAQGAPATTAPAPPAQRPDVDLSEIEQALEAANCPPAAVPIISLYMAFELSPARATEAVRKLSASTDPTTQKKALDALVTLTEKHRGEPLPMEPAPEDDIPF